MNSENSTLSPNGHLLIENHFKTIAIFVEKYDALYKDLGLLENDIQSLLKRQGDIVKLLEDTRKEEEIFFTKLSKETGKDVAYLKQLATAWVIENKR